MDPFEDFEFKPLTDGLGFHKKAERIKEEIKGSHLSDIRVGRSIPETPRSVATETDSSTTPPIARSASQSISDLIAALPPSLDFLDEPEKPIPTPVPVATRANTARGFVVEPARPQIFQPLGREEYKSSQTPAPTPVPPPAPLASPPKAGTMAASGAKPAAPMSMPTLPIPGSTAKTPAKPLPPVVPPAARSLQPIDAAIPAPMVTEPREVELVKVSASPSAAILDAMVALGFATIALVCILLITNIDLVGMLANAKTDGPTQLHLGVLFAAILYLYMLTARSFGGASLGEWAFEMQLGTDADQRKTIYPLLVVWRTFVVTVTGFVVLPLLSLIARRDLTAYLCGLQLYRRETR